MFINQLEADKALNLYIINKDQENYLSVNMCKLRSPMQ